MTPLDAFGPSAAGVLVLLWLAWATWEVAKHVRYGRRWSDLRGALDSLERLLRADRMQRTAPGQRCPHSDQPVNVEPADPSIHWSRGECECGAKLRVSLYLGGSSPVIEAHDIPTG